jgi:hypothetical protein
VAQTTIGFGIALIALGVIGYAATSFASATALIPAIFGLLLLILGLLARNERYRMHAMHGAAVIALIGLLGSIRGVGGGVRLLLGGEVARPAAAISQTLMAILLAVFIGLCVRSFVEARRQRSV